MSVFLKGVTFKDRFVRPQEDAALMAAICADGLYGGCQVSYTGAALKLSPGRIIACGRISVVDTETSISVTGTGSFARLVLTLDLSRSATTSAFEQAALDVEVAAAQSDFAELTQGDINSGATVYQLEICRVTLSNGSISGILYTCGQAHGRAGGVTVTLPRAGLRRARQRQRLPGCGRAHRGPERRADHLLLRLRPRGGSAGQRAPELRCRHAVQFRLQHRRQHRRGRLLLCREA